MPGHSIAQLCNILTVQVLHLGTEWLSSLELNQACRFEGQVCMFVWCLVLPWWWWGYQLTKTVQNGGPQAISEILHIEYWIVCCIVVLTYLIHIYHMSKCSKCDWKRYIEGFCMWNVHFHINGLSPNIIYVILMSWPLMAIYFLLLNYWLFFFCAVFISYLMVINSKKHKSKYPNTIWWIMPCIISELWKIAINP